MSARGNAAYYRRGEPTRAARVEFTADRPQNGDDQNNGAAGAVILVVRGASGTPCVSAAINGVATGAATGSGGVGRMPVISSAIRAAYVQLRRSTMVGGS